MNSRTKQLIQNCADNNGKIIVNVYRNETKKLFWENLVSLGLFVEYARDNYAIEYHLTQKAYEAIKPQDTIVTTVENSLNVTDEIIEKVENSLNRDMKSTAKFQNNNRPTYKVFNPTAKFRKEHLSAKPVYVDKIVQDDSHDNVDYAEIETFEPIGKYYCRIQYLFDIANELGYEIKHTASWAIPYLVRRYSSASHLNWQRTDMQLRISRAYQEPLSRDELLRDIADYKKGE